MRLPYYSEFEIGIEFQEFCPITASCFWEQRGEFEVDRYQAVGRRIGLSRRLANLIAKAADSEIDWFMDVQKSNSRRKLLLQIRHDLLCATGLSKTLRKEEHYLKELGTG